MGDPFTVYPSQEIYGVRWEIGRVFIAIGFQTISYRGKIRSGKCIRHNQKPCMLAKGVKNSTVSTGRFKNFLFGRAFPWVPLDYRSGRAMLGGDNVW
jgi:hypothetical protein